MKVVTYKCVSQDDYAIVYHVFSPDGTQLPHREGTDLYDMSQSECINAAYREALKLGEMNRNEYGEVDYNCELVNQHAEGGRPTWDITFKVHDRRNQ